MALNNKELDIILQEGEGYRIEFKERISELDREMVAFANSSGGRIFLGISDSGEVKVLYNNLAVLLFAKKVGLSSDVVKYHIEALKKAGLIIHRGSTKKGNWEILK